MSDCIFCRIVSGEIPITPVYEDADVIVFDDIAPQAPVHTLIVPKVHVENLNDSPEPEMLARAFGIVAHVAKLKGIDQSGYRVIQNNGPDAGQTVHHLHIHVLGGKPLGEGMVGH